MNMVPSVPLPSAEALLREGVLSRVLHCPTCGSPEREAFHLPYQSNRYIQSAASLLHLEEEALFEMLEAKRCTACRAVYFDPWLSVLFTGKVYRERYPQHNLGWYEFYHIVANPERTLERSSLVQKLREVLPSLKTYAEIGCPFQGLIPFFSVRKYQYKAKVFYDYPGTIRFHAKTGRYPEVKGNAVNLERIGQLFSNAFNRSQLLRAFPLHRLLERYWHQNGHLEVLEAHPVECFYLHKDSVALWGSQCRSLGIGCREMLVDVFQCHSLNLEDLRATEMKFDLISVFNALDHYLQPLRLLEDLFRFTDYVYVEGQVSTLRGGKQHPFFLEEEVFRRLTIPGVVPVSGFKGIEKNNWYSILLRRQEGS